MNQEHAAYVRPSGTPCKHYVASSFCQTSCIQPTPARPKTQNWYPYKDHQRGKREPVQKRRTGIHGKTDNVANVEPQAGEPRTSWLCKAIGNSLQTLCCKQLLPDLMHPTNPCSSKNAELVSR